MGEAKLKQSATQKFIAEYPLCCFCAGMRAATTREHMPPKSLFDNSHRPDKLVMPACDGCNNGTSTADLVAAIMSRWAVENTEQEHQDHERLVRRLRKQAPAVIDEWTSTRLKDRIKGRRHLREHGVTIPDDVGIVAIGKISVRYLNLFAHKVALALYFEHFRQPLLPPGAYRATWRTKEDFARNGVPRELLELFPNYGTLTQGRWSEHETFEYRSAVNRNDGIFGFFARFRWGLFVLGFAVLNAAVLAAHERAAHDPDWVTAGDLLRLLETARIEEKL
jgi:hypothetical protein